MLAEVVSRIGETKRKQEPIQNYPIPDSDLLPPHNFDAAKQLRLCLKIETQVRATAVAASKPLSPVWGTSPAPNDTSGCQLAVAQRNKNVSVRSHQPGHWLWVSHLGGGPERQGDGSAALASLRWKQSKTKSIAQTK